MLLATTTSRPGSDGKRKSRKPKTLGLARGVFAVYSMQFAVCTIVYSVPGVLYETIPFLDNYIISFFNFFFLIGFFYLFFKSSIFRDYQ